MHNNQSNNYKILLVGAGKMGAAILSGLLGLMNIEILVIDPMAEKTIAADISGDKSRKCCFISQFNSAEINKFLPNIVIFAVKPQTIGDIITDYKFLANKSVVFISIIAGKKIEFFEEYLGKQAAVIRTMPNLPVSVNAGITAFVANKAAASNAKIITDVIFGNIGKVVALQDENLLDAVTAISGSGPAYVFYFIESLTKAAIDLGLPEDIAKILAINTVYGSALLANSSELPVNILRENVTSKAGTTDAALQVLFKDEQFLEVIKSATKAAALRSKELSGSNAF